MRSVAVFTVFKSSRRLVSHLLVGVVLSLVAQTGYSFETPNWKITPGVVCTSSDPDFKGYDYPEHVARCNRNVTLEMKIEIAKNYGDIPRSEWNNYEFDHLLPLCAGGSNSIGNVWPQPIDEAKKKDVLENEICLQLRDGTITQAQALQKIRDWFDAMAKTGSPGPNPLPGQQPSPDQQSSQQQPPQQQQDGGI